MGMASKQAKIQNKSNIRQYNYNMKQFAAQKADLEREVELTNKIQEETFAYQQNVRNLERLSILDQYERSQDQYKQQLNWNNQAAEAAVESQNRVFRERIADAKQQAEDQRLQLRRTNITAQYNLDQAEFALNEAIYGAEAAKEKTRQDFRSQQLAIGAEQSNLTKQKEMAAIEEINLQNKERDALADRNFETLSAEIEQIMQQGAALAQGRTGKSAAATLQSTIASFAFNTAKIEDALYRSKQAVASERAALTSTTEAIGREEGFLTQRTTLAQDRRDLSIAEADVSLKQTRGKLKLDTEKLYKDLDIDIAVFEQNQKRLGESLVSAAEARVSAMSEIARGKVQADLEADAMRMLPPRFAPDPPRPYKAEMPTLVPPPEPVEVDKEAYQVPQPKPQSGLSKILSIGGAVLGIAGSVFTGGASLGLTMGLGSAATASTVGLGLGAASKGLGLIGSYM